MRKVLVSVGLALALCAHVAGAKLATAPASLAAPRRLLGDSRLSSLDAKVEADFKELETVEAAVEQSIDAAEKDGDLEEADSQQEVLEGLEEAVIEVAAAEESEAAHEAAAESAASHGDFEEARSLAS